MINLAEKIKEIHLFSELSFEQLRHITDISQMVEIKKQKILFNEGDLYRGFYILLEGRIKVFHITEVGKEVIIHLIKPLQPFAELPLFEGMLYPVSAEALQDSTLLFFPKDEFVKVLQQNHDISFKMLAGFAKRLRSLTQKIEELTSKEVTSRLARFLIQEVNNSGTKEFPEPFIKLTISKSSIAGYIGTITETLSRTFKKLQEEQIIRVDGKKIFFSDYSRLKELAR